MEDEARKIAEAMRRVRFTDPMIGEVVLLSHAIDIAVGNVEEARAEERAAKNESDRRVGETTRQLAATFKKNGEAWAERDGFKEAMETAIAEREAAERRVAEADAMLCEADTMLAALDADEDPLLRRIATRVRGSLGALRGAKGK